jgi:hypothetical protein
LKNEKERYVKRDFDFDLNEKSQASRRNGPHQPGPKGPSFLARARYWPFLFVIIIRNIQTKGGCVVKELRPEHYIAIHYLAQPRKGGKTMQEIADECGVSRKTLYEWKKDDLFNRELKRQVVRNTLDKLPEVADSMADAAIEDRNAAAAKLIFQMHELLSENLHVETSEKKNEDVDLAHLRELAQKYAGDTDEK